MGKNWKWQYFLGLQNHCSDCHHEFKKYLLLGRKAMNNLDSIFKKQRNHLADKGLYSQSYGFSISHVWIWVLDHKESWVQNGWHFQTGALEKILESPLDSKEIKPVNPKGNQPWIFIRRTNSEAKLQYFGHLMWRDDSLEKTLMLGKTEGKREEGIREWDG